MQRRQDNKDRVARMEARFVPLSRKKNWMKRGLILSVILSIASILLSLFSLAWTFRLYDIAVHGL